MSFDPNIFAMTGAAGLMVSAALIVIGIIMLVKGGSWTIDSAVYVARHFGISKLVVGFTIVAFGTSLPELVISVLANLQGSAGIAVGNVIGSNIANMLLVIGAAGFFVTVQATRSKALFKDLGFMMLATLALVALLLGGEINQLAGSLMILVLLIYVFLQYRMAMKGERPLENEDDQTEFSFPYAPYVFLILGLILIALGAEFLVRGAKMSATIIGVPEAVIALSIIALGTSLPELSTCLIAMRKNQSDMVLGNIIGSNVFNILMILGFTTMIKPISSQNFAPQLVEFDIWVVLAVSVIFTAILLLYNKINKPIGLVFMGAYIIYNIYIYALYIGA